ncbi:tat pathway signal sequence, partial [Metarhizium hybridum]
MFTGDTSYQYPTRLLERLSQGAIRVGEKIARTGRFGATVFRRRLLETLQYTLQVNHNTEGIKSGGEGHLVCVRVRLFHSTVRLEMTSLTTQDPTCYGVQKYGAPIKDLASLGTIHTFSSTVLWQGLPRQGIHMSE